jgi:hypothetical protein
MVLFECVATVFDRLQGHLEGTREYKSRITIASFFLDQNELSVLLAHSAY